MAANAVSARLRELPKMGYPYDREREKGKGRAGREIYTMRIPAPE